MEKPDLDTPVDKSSGVTSNTPFICDSIKDDARCAKPAAWLYRTAFTTKLVCDGCSRELKGQSVEFHLCELAPARVALVAELKAAKEALDGTKEHLRQAWKLLDALEKTPIVGWFVKRQIREAL